MLFEDRALSIKGMMGDMGSREADEGGLRVGSWVNGLVGNGLGS